MENMKRFPWREGVMENMKRMRKGTTMLVQECPEWATLSSEEISDLFPNTLDVEGFEMHEDDGIEDYYPVVMNFLEVA